MQLVTYGAISQVTSLNNTCNFPPNTNNTSEIYTYNAMQVIIEQEVSYQAVLKERRKNMCKYYV